MSKIVEFKIGKGKTLKPSEAEEWIRRYLEVTIKLPETSGEQDFHEALIRAERIIDNWLAEPEVHVPNLNLDMINELVWTRYVDRKRAEKPDEAAWTLADVKRHPVEKQKIIAQLVDAILKAGGTLHVGNVEFKLSGNKQFISRRPIKA